MVWTVRNWAKFQHFKDRKPPWIKFYRDILDDIEWHELSGDDAKTLVMLWLIASESSGELPDTKTLAFRLRTTPKAIEQQLSRLGHWLISERYQDDINVSQKNSATELNSSATDIEMPLRERDREETERDLSTTNVVDCPQAADVKKSPIPDCPNQEIVELYHQHLPTLRRVEVLSDMRKSLLRSRWREVVAGDIKRDKSEGLQWFAEYFTYVNQSDFLTGKTSRPGVSPFTADFEWLIRPSNFVKVVEGKYHREAA